MMINWIHMDGGEETKLVGHYKLWKSLSSMAVIVETCCSAHSEYIEQKLIVYIEHNPKIALNLDKWPLTLHLLVDGVTIWVLMVVSIASVSTFLYPQHEPLLKRN